jgi:hypothetical protein
MLTVAMAIRLHAQGPYEVWLERSPAGLAVVEVHDGARGPARALPAEALDRVFARYGRPLEDGIEHVPREDARLDAVSLLFFRRWGDVEPQAYVVHAGEATLAAPAPLVAAALVAIGKAAAG